MRNIGLKILSVVIAIFLALFVHRESNNLNTSIGVAVEVQNLPPDKLIIHSPSQVQVSLRGPTYLIQKTLASPPTFKVKLPADAPNFFKTTLHEEDLGLRAPVEVVSIEPGTIELTLDNRVTRTVPIVVPRIGQVSGALKVDDVFVSPETVEITGPETELKALGSVETDPIDFRNIHDSIVRQLELRAPGKYSKLNVGTATVRVKISSVQLEKKISALPIQVRAMPGETYTLTPRQVSVEVTGAKEPVDALSREDVVPYVKIKEGLKDNELVVVGVDLPKGLSLVSIEPENVQVKRTFPAPVEATKGGRR